VEALLLYRSSERCNPLPLEESSKPSYISELLEKWTDSIVEIDASYASRGKALNAPWQL